MKTAISIPLTALAALVTLLVAWAVYRFVIARRRGLNRVFDEIAFDRVDGMIVPNGDEGVIQIDHLLLTSQGLLIVHVKDAPGTVFGGDKLKDWTVMAADRRYTFANPQPALYDRVAAVRQIVRDVPVEGRILFLDGAEFAKGVPDLVTTSDELRREFSDSDKAAAERKVEAFKPHWEQLAKHAVRS